MEKPNGAAPGRVMADTHREGLQIRDCNMWVPIR
jgi:hypothetical protein